MAGRESLEGTVGTVSSAAGRDSDDGTNRRAVAGRESDEEAEKLIRARRPDGKRGVSAFGGEAGGVPAIGGEAGGGGPLDEKAVTVSYDGEVSALPARRPLGAESGGGDGGGGGGFLGGRHLPPRRPSEDSEDGVHVRTRRSSVIPSGLTAAELLRSE